MIENGISVPKDSSDQGSLIYGLDWVLYCLSIIFVLVRLGTRTWITQNFGWDDATIALTQSVVTVGKAIVILEIRNGLGQHKQELAPPTYIKYMKYDYIDWAQVFLALALTKISICLFLLRLSQFNWLRRFLYSLIGFVVVTHAPLFFLIIFQCNPIAKYWHTEMPGSCFRKATAEKIIIVQGLFSILTDFICAGFPAILLWNSKIRRWTKIALCTLMGLGIITALISIVRTAYSWQIKSKDVTWDGVPNAVARLFEVNVGVIAACAPIMKPFFRYVHARLSGNDPHGLVRKSSFTEWSWHNHWYSRIWSQRPSLPTAHPTHGFRTTSHVDFSSVKPSKRSKSSYGFGAQVPMTEYLTDRSVSLDLPMQGISGTEERGKAMVDFKDSVPYDSSQKGGSSRLTNSYVV